MSDLKINFSRRVLLRLIVLALLGATLLTLQFDFIRQVYLEEANTPVGRYINAGILLLFVLGIGKLVMLLLRYQREENALRTFARALEDGDKRPHERVRADSLIHQRYKALAVLSRQHAPIEHSALASMLLAFEETRLSFPKFINNILILTGVFGTIVSLSIALVGASDLLQATRDTSGMGTVIHGMSTALSTTMTAIVCYLFYGYFYIKLLDAKTRLVSNIEQITSLYLLPRFNQGPDRLLHEVGALVQALRQTSEGMQHTQGAYLEAGEGLRQGVQALHGELDGLGRGLSEIKQLLREGFRLPANGDGES